jgi:hypothetical protein
MLKFYIQLSVLNTEVTHMKCDIEVYHKYTYKLCTYHFVLHMLKFEMMSENLEVTGNYISENYGQKYKTNLIEWAIKVIWPTTLDF